MKPFYKNQNEKLSPKKSISRKKIFAFASILATLAIAYDLYVLYRDTQLARFPNRSFLHERLFDWRHFAASPPTPTDLIRYIKEFSNFDAKKLARIDLSINYKNLSNLECQRREKSRSNQCLDYKFKWSKGTLRTLGNDDNSYRVKIRAKGDRHLHFQDPANFSMKVDIKGDPRLWGMEEFSIQDPIIRNYTYEAFASEALRQEGIITPRHFYAKLFINGTDKGVKHFEEAVAKEMVESNQRRYGPTYSLNETSPDMPFELQDQKFWSQNNLPLAQRGLNILNNFESRPQDLRDNIVVEKWAKFFAFIDTFNLYHGALRKSVKYYLNPSYGKFEPVFVDGHIVPRWYDDFTFLDFLMNKHPECQWVCYDNERPFFEVFFGTLEQPNKPFIKLYLKHLKRYSSPEYINSFISHVDSYAYVRSELYRGFAKSDSIFHRSYIPHILSVDKIKKRANKIHSFLLDDANNLSKTLRLDAPSSQNKSTKFVQLGGKIYVDEDTRFEDMNILFDADTEFILASNTTLSFVNSTVKTSDNVRIMLSGEFQSMVVFESVSGNIFSLNADRLSQNSGNNRILYGGLNFINSNLYLDNLSVKNSLSEDGVNFIDSDVRLGRAKFENIQSDALDADFSKLAINNISCNRVNNDCLDISFSNVVVNTLEAFEVKDKALSAGEESSITLKNMFVKNSDMGVVAKDQSKVRLENFVVERTKVPIALFVKKPEFGPPSLIISQSTPDSVLAQSLISNDSILKVSNKTVKGLYSSEDVLNKLYGNEFGVKTVR